MLIVGAALLGGGSRTPPPLLADVSQAPSSTPSAPSAAVAGGPLDEAYRATWLTSIPELPLNRSGSGPVSLEISNTGTGLATQNIGPGATFDSTVTDMGDGTIRLVLDGAATDCLAGAAGIYRAKLTDDGSLLNLVSQHDDCATRQEALVCMVPSSYRLDVEGSGYVMIVDPRVQCQASSIRPCPVEHSTTSSGRQLERLRVPAVQVPQGFTDPCRPHRSVFQTSPGC